MKINRIEITMESCLEISVTGISRHHIKSNPKCFKLFIDSFYKTGQITFTHTSFFRVRRIY
jgi:hypothetical protein